MVLKRNLPGGLKKLFWSSSKIFQGKFELRCSNFSSSKNLNFKLNTFMLSVSNHLTKYEWLSSFSRICNCLCLGKFSLEELELEKSFFETVMWPSFWSKKMVVGHSRMFIFFPVNFKNIRRIDWYHLHHHRTSQSTYMAGKSKKRRFFKIDTTKEDFGAWKKLFSNCRVA